MKKRTIYLIPLLIASIFILSACQILPWVRVVRGSGNLATETRQVSGFNAIRMDGAGRVLITQGAAESLEIEAEDNLLGELTSRVEGDTLVLGYQDRPWRKTVLPTQAIVYTLTVIDLSKLTLNGAGDLEIRALQTESLVLEINGAGNIDIVDLSGDELSVNLAGTGSITASGIVADQEISLDGAGNYQGADMQTQRTKIDINGLGNSTVWATESLDISINGGGSVSYYGSPNVSQQISGLGDVRNLGEK